MRVFGELMDSLEVNPPSRRSFEAFFDAQMTDGLVEGSLKRLVVRRLQTLDGLVAGGAGTDCAVDLPDPGTMSDRERAVVEFVDAFSLDFRTVPDAVWDRLRSGFDTPQLTELTWTVAVVKGMLRVRAALHDHPSS